MFTFLLVVHAIIAAALVAVILMQRSEGGGLGMGGSPSGLMSARGAADFLTRATTVLATLFVAMCIFLAVLASMRAGGSELDTTLVRPSTPAQQAPFGAAPAPVPTAPTTDPLAGAAAPVTVPAPAAPKQTAPATRTQKAPAKPANPDPVAQTPTTPASVAPPPAVRTTPGAPAPANGSETPNP